MLAWHRPDRVCLFDCGISLVRPPSTNECEQCSMFLFFSNLLNVKGHTAGVDSTQERKSEKQRQSAVILFPTLKHLAFITQLARELCGIAAVTRVSFSFLPACLVACLHACTSPWLSSPLCPYLGLPRSLLPSLLPSLCSLLVVCRLAVRFLVYFRPDGGRTAR